MDETLIRAQQRELTRTGRYYRHVCWMAVPLLCMSCYFYGLRPLLLCGAAVITGNLCDRLVSLLRRRVYQFNDLSSESFALLIALLMPATVDWYVLIAAVLAGVFIGKEVFGGTGMNVFNPALLARAFLFFSYPSSMTGDTILVATEPILGMGFKAPDGYTMATPLGEIAQHADVSASFNDMIIGLIPGSMGETSVIAIAIGAVILLWTGIASWKTMLSVFLGGGLMAVVFEQLGMSSIPWYEHIVLGGFCFGAVFMATDPVTSARTESGKWVYGALIGIMAVVVRVMNPGYPEGMMLAILFGNMFAPLIDYCVVDRNISRRSKRGAQKNANQ